MVASIKVDVRSVNAALRKLPDVITARARKSLTDSGNEFVGAMFKSFGTPGRNRSRSGLLRGSIQFVVEGAKFDDLRLVVYSAGVVYANLQEHGGTVRPKPPLKYLAIPIDDNLTPAGVATYPSAKALRGKGTFVLRLKSGGLYIVRREGDDLKFLFKLVRSATVPPRLGFRKTWDELAANRNTRLVQAITAGIAEVGL